MTMQNNQTRRLSNTVQSICEWVEPARAVPDLAEDVRAGLLEPPRSLPPKYFYDVRGSQLFKRICETPEYYPTRTEDKLLGNHGKTIIEQTQPEQILELGSGDAQKTRRLFDACEKINHTCHYLPFDVCEEILENTANQLQSDYNWLTVSPLVGDYYAGLTNLPESEGRRLFVFLGSTIGNFTPDGARNFIAEIKQCMKTGDYFLLGADRIKDPDILDAAYNDTEGITAEFNLNILQVLNRELGADFDVSAFKHKAEFNTSEERIEMHLISNTEQEVHINDLNETILFKQGDGILTEISHKFTPYRIENLLKQCDLEIVQHHEPEDQFFSIILAQCN